MERQRGAGRSVIIRGDKNVIWGRVVSREGGKESLFRDAKNKVLS